MTFSRALVLAALLAAAVPAQAQTITALPGPLVTVDQVIAMKKAGVSDAVIRALVQRDRPVFVIDAPQTPSTPAPQPCVAAPRVAPPPSSINGIFFARPTPGIFFVQRPAGCRP